MKVLLFGSIGTICDCSDLQLEGYNQAFEEAGLSWHWDTPSYRQMLLLPGGKARLRRYAEKIDEPSVGEDMIEKLHSRKTEIFNQLLCEGHAHLRPGVQRLMDAALESRIRLGLVTTTEQRNLEAIDKALGREFNLSDFDIVTDRTLAFEEKPASAAYRIALQSLGCRAEEALAIEDTAACVASAVAAGIPCIATPNSFALDQSFSEAVACVTHLGDNHDPAKQVAGLPVVENGMVTIDSLSRLLIERSAEAIA